MNIMRIKIRKAHRPIWASKARKVDSKLSIWIRKCLKKEKKIKEMRISNPRFVSVSKESSMTNWFS